MNSVRTMLFKRIGVFPRYASFLSSGIVLGWLIMVNPLLFTVKAANSYITEVGVTAGTSRPAGSSELASLAPSLSSEICVQLTAVATGMVKVKGFGVMGDSGSDEYRADDNRGGEFANTTLNWIELLVKKRGLNFGPWGTWGEPRRTGYKYNWARSGATTSDLITSGQHTGLAEQVSNGEVSHVLIWIGVNDFTLWNGTYKEIYEGELSGAELQAKIDRIISEITTAVDTVLQAGDVKIVVVTIVDKGLDPQTVKEMPDPVKRQRVTEAVNKVNAGIEALAEARDLAVAHPENILGGSFLEKVNNNGFIEIGGVQLELTKRGNDPHHILLDDSDGHVGTVISGLFANRIFIESFNRKYGLEITPLSNEEILEVAGLSSGSNWLGFLSAGTIVTILLSIFLLTKWKSR